VKSSASLIPTKPATTWALPSIKTCPPNFFFFSCDLVGSPFLKQPQTRERKMCWVTCLPTTKKKEKEELVFMFMITFTLCFRTWVKLTSGRQGVRPSPKPLI